MINSGKISTTDSDKGKLVEVIKAGLKPVDQPSFPVNEPEQGSEANEPNRESSFTTRRALLKAGWAVPVILTVGLPSMVLAGATSPVRRHDHKPKGHFDCPPKKKHSFDFDKKKHSFDFDKKKHSFDFDKKKHHYDPLWWW